MRKMSVFVAGWLIKAKAILPQDKETYEYAVFCFLITFVPLALVMLIGGLLGIFFEAVFFVLPFMIMRKFSGGFHLKSNTACIIFSTFLISFFLLAVRYFIVVDISLILTFVIATSFISLIIHSPIDSKERSLSDKEKSVFKKVIIVMSFVIFAIYLSFLLNGLMNVAVPIGFGILLTALLQVPCMPRVWRKTAPN